MPKSYSNTERERIIRRLKDEVKILLKKYGVKKTSVDEIVRHANIPKGTFYLFYASKELLLFDVILEEHDEIQKYLIDSVAGYNGKITKNEFSHLLNTLYKRTTESFIYPLMTNGDMELIMQKLPIEAVKNHLAEDDCAIKHLFSLIPQAKGKDKKVFSGAFRAIFIMALHKRDIGENVFDKTIKLLIDSITEKLFMDKI